MHRRSADVRVAAVDANIAAAFTGVRASNDQAPIVDLLSAYGVRLEDFRGPTAGRTLERKRVMLKWPAVIPIESTIRGIVPGTRVSTMKRSMTSFFGSTYHSLERQESLTGFPYPGTSGPTTDECRIEKNSSAQTPCAITSAHTFDLLLGKHRSTSRIGAVWKPGSKGRMLYLRGGCGPLIHDRSACIIQCVVRRRSLAVVDGAAARGSAVGSKGCSSWPCSCSACSSSSLSLPVSSTTSTGGESELPERRTLTYSLLLPEPEPEPECSRSRRG